MAAGSRRVAAAIALLCLSGFAVYPGYVVLDHTDDVTGRTFRAVSLERYQLALAGRAPFPYQDSFKSRNVLHSHRHRL